jgi:hypothetical protein
MTKNCERLCRTLALKEPNHPNFDPALFSNHHKNLSTDTDADTDILLSCPAHVAR